MQLRLARMRLDLETMSGMDSTPDPCVKPSVPSELWVGLCQVSSFTNVLNQLSSGNVKKKQTNRITKETVQTKTGENTKFPHESAYTQVCRLLDYVG